MRNPSRRQSRLAWALKGGLNLRLRQDERIVPGAGGTGAKASMCTGATLRKHEQCVLPGDWRV